ncbi:transglycosylase domain-containing protein [Nocardioides antri]|uniref:Glycosyl transferase n=1 Tax=Nocardioides antri TaxID=2607659 RepID=A0A5B1M7N3_9ACTN|nr:transglycosylase domain-containing protein [Nocardioides antri]KAA1428724.1 glycosyl transferase [Nocardioides antri]
MTASADGGSRTRGGAICQLTRMLSVAVVVGVLVGLAVAPVVGLTAMFLADVTRHFPAPLSFEPLPQRSEVVDRNGETVATFYQRNRVVVTLDEVDPLLVDAVLAIEDNRFFQHGAMDPQGTMRAFVTNLLRQEQAQGGSSITQQLVKLTLVEQAGSRRGRLEAVEPTYERKVVELRHAAWLEQSHSKEWILERYLNIAYFGEGAYGVEVAAQHYFSRSAEHLSLRQAALLAGLVSRPEGQDPVEQPGRAKDRRNVVLDRMAEVGVISAERAARTKELGLGLQVAPTPNGCVRSAAPFFCDYLLAYLLRQPALGVSEAAREELLHTGGLTIRTTVDLRFQRAAEQAARAHVRPTDQAIGALAMLAPGSGDVLALAQSRPMGRDRQEGETFLNYVVPQEYGDANGFQAGSTFKVFVLAAAIEQGIPLDTEIRAPQRISLPVSGFRTCQGYPRSTQVWSPRNSTGSGTFDLYTGTQQSVNTFYAQLERRTGLCRPYRLARAMGIPLTDPATQQVPSFTLGVVDVSPLEMAEAYATFAARGRHCAARPVTEVLDAEGQVLDSYSADCRRILDPGVADAVNDVLRGVQETGGFGYEAGLGLDQQSAAKTGTTDENRSVWFIGYTPNLAAAAMLAGADDDGHWRTLNRQVIGGEFVSEAFGSTHAGPIWGDAMKAVEQWLPDTTFTPPPRRYPPEPEQP